jgi:DDE domain
MRIAHRRRPPVPPRSAFAGFRFPPDVIVVAVRWYLRFGLPYRDVEELLAERGVEVDHVTVYRWVLRFTPLLVDAARPCRHATGDRWQVDETYVKVASQWRYVYRAIDQSARSSTCSSPPPGRQGRPPVLRAGDQYHKDRAGRGHDRQGAGVPGGAGGAPTGGVASNRAVREQPGRGGSRPAEGAFATDARAQAGPQRQGNHRRARLHPESSARTLRARGPAASQPATVGRVR